MSEIIDSHAHLVWESFNQDLEQVIERARQHNVVQIVQAGVDLQTIPEMIQLVERYAQIFFGAGMHPHEARHWNADSRSVLQSAAGHPKNIAIGECGLDFHYHFSDRQTQLSVLQAQVELAGELGKPLIIHCREAWEETLTVLREAGQGKVKGVFHSFTGGPEVLADADDLDFYISFSGIVTFHNAQSIQKAAALVRADRIMVETDCPYLAPHPLRGKRNEPANVWYTVKKLAELRNTTEEEMAAVATSNTRKLFRMEPSRAGV